MRIGLGVAWLVVVAAEMIALRSGLGYMIMDSRNAGNRYDLVIAGMIIIGLIGLSLDGLMRTAGTASGGSGGAMRTKIEVRDLQQELPVRQGPAAGRRRGELHGARRRIRRHRRTFRLRQVHADEHDGRLHAAGCRRGRRSTACRARSRISTAILISQQGSVFPWLTVRENLMFGLNGHAPAQQARDRRPLRRHRRPQGLRGQAIRTSCRAAC